MAHHASPLKYLYPYWYTVVMGLCVLSLAWRRAVPIFGSGAGKIALTIGALATAVFVAILVATVVRAIRHPEVWAEDWSHPVRHSFYAALPTALLLLSTVAVAVFGPTIGTVALWWLGSLSQLFVTLWVLARWWRGSMNDSMPWDTVTPVLFLPIVGNALAPLAGVPLGQVGWSATQFGLGLLLWPVALVLVATRIALRGMFASRLLPTLFIALAPPAVIGLSVMQLGASSDVGWGLWWVGLLTLMWLGIQVRRIIGLPFSLLHWAMSFPLAAFAALTLRLATPGTVMVVLGPVLLGLSSIVMLWLLLSTARGLSDGSLLAPEQPAQIAATER